MHPLDAYLKANNVRAAAFAKQLGRATSTITRLIDGSKRPSAALMRQISDATGGIVTPSNLVDALPDGQNVAPPRCEVKAGHSMSPDGDAPESASKRSRSACEAA